MRSDDPEDAQLNPPYEPRPGSGVPPSLRARRLFAEGVEEFAAWDVVAHQLDPDTYVHSDPDARAAYRRFLAQIRDIEGSGQGMHAAPELRSDARRFTESTVRESRISNPRSSRVLYLRTWRVLAIGCAIVAANVAGYAFFANRSNQLDHGASGITYATRNGERTSIILRDGTKVMLNVGSRLQVPRVYGTQTRSVFLEGEAEFIVEHNSARPFIVHAGETVVRDLATRFSVRAYRNGGRTTVAVAEGRVAVYASTLQQPSSATLDAGHVATVLLNQGLSVEKQRSPADYFGWTKGVLTFTHVPVGEALAQIARWYDVDCNVSDPGLLASDLTFSFTEKTLTEKELQDLGDVLGASIVRKGRLITFIPLSP